MKLELRHFGEGEGRTMFKGEVNPNLLIIPGSGVGFALSFWGFTDRDACEEADLDVDEVLMVMLPTWRVAQILGRCKQCVDRSVDCMLHCERGWSKDSVFLFQEENLSHIGVYQLHTDFE